MLQCAKVCNLTWKIQYKSTRGKCYVYFTMIKEVQEIVFFSYQNGRIQKVVLLYCGEEEYKKTECGENTNL